MMLTKRYRSYALAVSAFALSACADNSTAPKSMISSLSARHDATSGGGSFLRSNSTQYRAQTLPHQSNRSGLATLTSRALLGKDGQTVLEVTTGQLDAVGAPGNISKLQEKLMDPNKALFATLNFNGLTGPVQTRTFAGLPRHGYIQTQGNVRDIDPKRTDVVTITERVNYRPDLGLTSIDAPDKSKPGQSFIVTAAVTELNGDVGAYDDCVLYVDGGEAARINHQWVADGDAVNCAFRISIAAIGRHTLEVRSENVVPGDWDMANNAASRTIEIVNPEIVLHGYMYANDYDYNYRNFQDYSYTDIGGRVYRSYYDYVSRQRSSYAGFYAYAYGQPGAGDLTSVDFKITSGGTRIGGVTKSNLTGGPCFYGIDDNYNSWLYVCSWNGYAYAQGWTNSGHATYYSYGFYYDNYYGNGYYYSYGPYSSDQTWGSGNNFSSNEVTLAFRAEGSTGTALLANASLTLGDWSTYYWWYYWYNQPLTCSDYSNSYYTQHNCYEYTQTQRYRNGFTSF